jgi:hypothetical protein
MLKEVSLNASVIFGLVWGADPSGTEWLWRSQCLARETGDKHRTSIRIARDMSCKRPTAGTGLRCSRSPVFILLVTVFAVGSSEESVFV